MPALPSTAECCPAQHCGHANVVSNWARTDWEHYAQERHREILAREEKLSAVYWQLGRALSVIRKDFTYGQWCRYLDQLGIDRPHASKATAIFRSFSAVEQVAELSVAQAYAARRNPNPASAAEGNVAAVAGSPSPPPQLEKFLTRCSKQAKTQCDQLPSLSADAARHLLPLVIDALERLEGLRRRLQAAALDDGFEA